MYIIGTYSKWLNYVLLYRTRLHMYSALRMTALNHQVWNRSYTLLKCRLIRRDRQESRFRHSCVISTQMNHYRTFLSKYMTQFRCEKLMILNTKKLYQQHVQFSSCSKYMHIQIFRTITVITSRLCIYMPTAVTKHRCK